jgi:hypothetical protein
VSSPRVTIFRREVLQDDKDEDNSDCTVLALPIAIERKCTEFIG